MNGSANTWGELLAMRSNQLFIGRRPEIEQFRLNCVYEIPESLLFVVHGTPGAGKSAMLRQLQQIGKEYGMLSARIDRSVGTGYTPQVIFNALRQLSQQIGESGAMLSTVEEHYRTYTDTLQIIADDETAPSAVFDAFSGLYDDDVWYSRAWQSYLEGKFSRNVIALLRDPVGLLTDAFVHDLNAWSMVRRVILCFDDWQVIGADLGSWLVDLLLSGRLRTQIWVALATSDPLSESWQALQAITAYFNLQPWTQEEAEHFLRLQDEEHPRRIEDVIKFAQGLPLWAELLSSATSGTAGDLALTPLDRYLKWLDDDTRRAVLLCSAARLMTEDRVALIMDNEFSPDIWTWLCASPLTQLRGEALTYQPSLRAQFVEAAWREYPERYRDLHQRLWDANLNKRGETFEALYHGFAGLVPEAIESTVITFGYLLRGELHRVDGMLDAIFEATSEMRRENVATLWAELLREGWLLIQQHEWEQSLVWLERLMVRDDITPAMETELQALHRRISARIPAPVIEEELAPDLEVAQVEIPLLPESAELEENPEEDLSLPEPAAPVEVTLESETAYQDTVPIEIDEIEPEPAPEEMTFDRGMRAMHEEDYDAALAAFDETLTFNTNHIEAHFQRGEVLAQTGKSEDAVMAYTQALMLAPDYLPASRQRGMEFLKQCKYATAVEDMDNVIAREPDDIAMRFRRGNALFNLECFAGAIEDYDAVLASNFEYVDAYINRGLSRKRIGAYGAAVEDFTTALQSRANSVRLLLYRGDTYARMQAYSSALADFDAAAAIKPEHAQVHNNCGLVYVKMERYEDALAAYQQAIALDEDFATAWYNGACAAGLSGDANTAVDMLTRAIQLRPAYKAMAQTDTDFDPIRESEALQALLDEAEGTD